MHTNKSGLCCQTSFYYFYIFKQATPTTLKFDPTSVAGGASLYTPAVAAAQSSRNIQTGGGFNGLATQSKIDGNLLQPLMGTGVSASSLKLPLGNGGMQLSEVGPIRHRQSRPASERPSPVAFDGKQEGGEKGKPKGREGE